MSSDHGECPPHNFGLPHARLFEPIQGIGEYVLRKVFCGFFDILQAEWRNFHDGFVAAIACKLSMQHIALFWNEFTNTECHWLAA